MDSPLFIFLVAVLCIVGFITLELAPDTLSELAPTTCFAGRAIVPC